MCSAPLICDTFPTNWNYLLLLKRDLYDMQA